MFSRICGGGGECYVWTPWDRYFGSGEKPVAMAMAKSCRCLWVGFGAAFGQTGEAWWVKMVVVFHSRGCVRQGNPTAVPSWRLPRLVVMGVLHERLWEIRAAEAHETIRQATLAGLLGSHARGLAVAA